MSRRTLTLFINLAIGIGFALAMWSREQAWQDNQYSGRVRWVSDGDTFRLAGESRPIRIWGVDAPELDSAQGLAARQFLIDLIDRKEVDCISMAIDKYGRIVARCRVEGIDISASVLNAGHATEMCRFSRGAYGTCR